jgi:threonine dehydratase
VDAVRGYGAQVELVPHSERETRVAELAANPGMTVVHPYDDPYVIAGQATAALELVAQVDALDYILTPIGGGGLLSGTSLVTAEHGITAAGAEPEVVDDSFRSLRDGVRYPATGMISVGDGLLTGIGQLPFDILSATDTAIHRVSEDEMIDAMRLFALRMKLVVEPSGATVLAAIRRYPEVFGGKRVGAIISGGNMALDRYCQDSV